MKSGREGGGREVPKAQLSEVLEGLNDLLQLDHDSVGAYEVARAYLVGADYVSQIEGFQRDHERHIRDLNDLILELGGTPANEPHATALLKEGIQRISAAGGDRALLTAWRANELQATSKYDTYARKAVFWPPQAKLLVDRNALDEERHYQWVAGVLGQRDPGETHLVNRLRERFGGRPHREGADGNAGFAGIRHKVADALGEAAERLERFSQGDHPAGFRARAAEGVHHTASGLDAAARTLRDPSALDPRPVVEGEVRENPVRSLIAIFAVGFVVGRILR